MHIMYVLVRAFVTPSSGLLQSVLAGDTGGCQRLERTVSSGMKT